MKVEYNNSLIARMSYTKFLGITIQNTLYWKYHADQLLPKLSAALCYESFKTVHYSRNINDGLLFFLSFDHELWYHLLG
jgi:hypothetical protein